MQRLSLPLPFIMQLTPLDEQELSRRGLNAADLIAQIRRFTSDIRPIKLEKPCVPSDGIVVLTPAECHRLLGIYEAEQSQFHILKLVPASGAASRMFKHLFNYNPESVSFLTEEFILRFEQFPFIPQLRLVLASKGQDMDAMIENNEWSSLFDAILNDFGLHYGNFPKGLVVFHNYEGTLRTAFEEHLHESIAYARDKSGKCRIHFTLAPHHIELVTSFLKEKVERNFPYEDFEITHSVQSEKTDTIALGKNDEPVRDKNGKLIFRPSGHGALIYNLQALDADIIFIKNIDNVTTDDQREESIFFKKILGGMLISLKSQINQLLNRIENDNTNALEDALEFVQQWFQPGIPLGINREQLKEYIRLSLDRPLRICGMVRNEGEPGGGPFWVRMSDGRLTKQIVEKNQIDLSDIHQARVLSESTHFNPVDIVCSIKNRKGNKYKLQNFVDHSTGFISEKFHDGRVIQALELPGLWNGSMALWNTIFVEVPVSTFTPVKTVNDLLRSGHQL